MNKTFNLVFCSLLALFLGSDFCVADEVNLIGDPALSSATVTLAGSSDTTATSGTGVIDLASVTSPFGTAQITELEIVLDDAMSFSFIGGAVTATSDPGAITIEMLTAGAAGTVTGGVFSQLQNEMAVSGLMNVLDPFNLVGGNQTFDLSTLDTELVDFDDVVISQSGSTITVTSDYTISTFIDANGNILDLDITGTIVATGVATIPEPASGALLVALPCLFLARRRARA